MTIVIFSNPETVVDTNRFKPLGQSISLTFSLET